MITSHRANLRAFSTTKQAKYLVAFAYIFWSIAASHHAIFMFVTNGQCGTSSSYSILFIGFGPSGILIIFASLIFRNLRQMRRCVQPFDQNIANRNPILQRRDQELLVLVIAEVIFLCYHNSTFTYGVFRDAD